MIFFQRAEKQDATVSDSTHGIRGIGLFNHKGIPYDTD